MPSENDSMFAAIEEGDFDIDHLLDPATLMLRLTGRGTVNVRLQRGSSGTDVVVRVQERAGIVVSVLPEGRNFQYRAVSRMLNAVFDESWSRTDKTLLKNTQDLLRTLASWHWRGSNGTPPLHWLVLGGTNHAW